MNKKKHSNAPARSEEGMDTAKPRSIHYREAKRWGRRGKDKQAYSTAEEAVRANPEIAIAYFLSHESDRLRANPENAIAYFLDHLGGVARKSREKQKSTAK